MLRKALLSITFALLSVALFVLGVMAQGADDSETAAVTVLPTVAAASVVQTVPVTLTLTIPGPTGPVTVEVPIYLSLDIRIGISPDMTPTLAITPSVVTDGEADNAPGTTVTATVESVVEEETAAPTATPTAAAPAATPLPEEVEAEPTAAPLPTATPTTTSTPLPVAVAPVCADPRAVITVPGVGEVVSGTAQILGTASHENFLYYKVEYAQGENVDPNATFSYLADSRVQVTGGLLATFDSTSFANGVYTLKLTVVDASGNFPPPCTVSVVIEN